MKVASGSFTTDGTAKVISTTVQPDLFLIKIDGFLRWIYHTKDMASNEAMSMDSNTDIQNDLVTARSATSITLGTNANVASSGKTAYWIAIEDDISGDFATFTYTGNGSSPRNITGMGIDPDFAFVKKDAATNGFLKFKDQTTGSAFQFGSSGENITSITEFITDGITVESNANSNTDVFYGFAFQDVTDKIETGTYSGNSVDGRNLSFASATIDPVFIIARVLGSDAFALRTADMTGDATFPHNATSAKTNRIQAINVGDMELGGDPEVNATGSTYVYLALMDNTGGGGGGNVIATASWSITNTVTMTGIRDPIATLTMPIDCFMAVAGQVEATHPTVTMACESSMSIDATVRGSGVIWDKQEPASGVTWTKQ